MKETVNTYREEKTAALLSPKAAIIVAVAIIFSAALICAGIYLSVEKINSSAAAADKKLIKENLTSAEEIDLANALRKSTVDSVYEKEAIPAYSTGQVYSMDVSKPSGVTISDLKLVTRGNLVGLEDAFLKGEEDYGVNCLFVMAIASLESANGTMCYRPNNMFGFGGMSFSSKEECIDVVSRALAQNYLSTSGSLYSGKTISDVNKRYASSSTWDDKVARNMTNYYSVISEHHNEALEKLK